MANYSELHQTINDNIKPNGNQQITGQVLQNVLNAIVDSLAEGYLFAGVATADGNPGSLDQNAWWLAGPGTYANYGNITVAEGKLAALMWSGEWSSSTVDVGGVIKAGTGIKLDESGAIAIDLVAGDFISIEGNKISCTLDANPFYFTDALPETPVPGTENKVYVVPNSEGTGYDLYQWDAETSAFNKVGSISFTFDPSDFVKKNEVNEAEGPTTLSGDMAYQLGLRNRTSQRVGIDFDNGAGDSINQMVVKSKAGNPATDSYMQMLLNGGDNVLTFDSDGLHVGDSSQSQRVLPTILLISNADHDFFIGPDVNGQPRTFTYPGLYNLLASIYPHKYKIRVVGETDIFDAEVSFIYKSATYDTYIIIYGKGKFVISASVSSDDTLKIYPVYAYARRILAKTYGISSWNNASGTSVELYNDLRSFIAGTYNSDGSLGFLCDINNTYAITDINTATGGVLLIAFQNAATQKTMLLEVSPTGEFSISAWPKVQVLWADSYNLIASGMPRPDAWLVADGTDVSLYNAVNEAYKHGYQLILKEYSYGYSGKLNQYTVKNILDLGTGYQLFYESNGLQYILTVNSSGSIDVTSNLFSAAEAGIDTFFPTSNKTYQSLSGFTAKITRVYNASMPIFLKTKSNNMMASEDARVPIINTSISTGGSISMYYIKVEASRISRYSMIIYPSGSVTVNTLGS